MKFSNSSVCALTVSKSHRKVLRSKGVPTSQAQDKGTGVLGR